jgi:hypothetical protein
MKASARRRIQQRELELDKSDIGVDPLKKERVPEVK